MQIGGLLVALALGISLATAAAAEPFRTPSISAVHVEWRAALDQLKSELSPRPAVARRFTFATRRTVPASDPRSMPAFEQLNAVTSQVFTGISRSPIPVLLPFDTAAYLNDRADGTPDSFSAAHYQSGFGPAAMFAAGESGYDALFLLSPGQSADLPARTYARPVEVQITGSILLYDIDDPFANRGKPVHKLDAQFPDLKRVVREGYVRYYFSRFGVPYVVSIRCHDTVARASHLSCQEASDVAEHVLKALRIVGGLPSTPRARQPANVAMRPIAQSPDFTYRPSGEIIANSGYREKGGHADQTVYSQIRFPLAKAPAYANSQSFLNWGDCFHRGRIPPPKHKGDAYHCKSNDKPLVFDESAGENYAYPWQDDFCEARDFEVGQCPAGFGHQGQDIRPSSCILRNDGADRCEPDKFPVVAVRDGVLIRSPKQEAVTLLVNTRTEHVRFRYMHMNPKRMDEDGILSGRRVTEGEPIGLVSNYLDDAGGTTTHLHFDVQVFTREGWLWVNPYVTLISAYERLIGGRGREVPATSAVSDGGNQQKQPGKSAISAADGND